jgi:hypothetical protein
LSFLRGYLLYKNASPLVSIAFLPTEQSKLAKAAADPCQQKLLSGQSLTWLFVSFLSRSVNCSDLRLNLERQGEQKITLSPTINLA